MRVVLNIIWLLFGGLWLARSAAPSSVNRDRRPAR